MENLNGENIVVGKGDCSITTIGLEISKSTSMKSNRMRFARKLAEKTTLDVEKLDQDYLLLNKLPFSEFVIQVLEHWKAKHAGQAKVSTLLQVLENHCMDETTGEMLRLLHNLPCMGWERPDLAWEHLSEAFQAKVHQTLMEETQYLEEDIRRMEPTLQRPVLIELMMGKRPSIGAADAAANSNDQDQSELEEMYNLC